MSANTLIEWAEHTWNPTLGCSKVSPGCANCYAIRQVHRLAGNPNPKIKAANAGLTVLQNHGTTINWTGKVRLIPERLDIPLRRRKPTTYFVNSLSDLFHEELPDEAIDRVFASMMLAPWHTFQVLTKRAKRLPEYFAHLAYRQEVVGILAEYESGLDRFITETGCDDDMIPRWTFPLPNVWLGVSVENREQLRRIEYLRKTPAALRFLSCEPLLEDLGQIDLTGIHWVIVGGESGKGARPFNVDWAMRIVGHCEEAGVPCFVKQLGAHVIQGGERRRKRDKKGGDMDEWPHELRVRHMPPPAVQSLATPSGNDARTHKEARHGCK